MDELEKSDRLIVPVKLANKAGQPAAESVEGRGLAKGNRPSIRTHSGHCTGSHAIFRWEGATGRTRRERRCHSAPTGLSFVPKAGARCGSAACRDLCGGRSVMTVPTATTAGVNKGKIAHQ